MIFQDMMKLETKVGGGECVFTCKEYLFPVSCVFMGGAKEWTGGRKIMGSYLLNSIQLNKAKYSIKI